MRKLVLLALVVLMVMAMAPLPVSGNGDPVGMCPPNPSTRGIEWTLGVPSSPSNADLVGDTDSIDCNGDGYLCFGSRFGVIGFLIIIDNNRQGGPDTT